MSANESPTQDPRSSWGPSYLDARQWSWVPEWLYPYLRPEMLAMLMLGFASGLPLYIFYSKTSIWLRAEGVERSTIGFFYWIGLAYTLKWIWAPVIDRLAVPVLSKLFGHRRSWMMVSIAGTVTGMVLLSTATPSDGLLMVLLGAGLIAFSGATLDVSIDAWRIESAPTKAQANMAASYSLGYRGALFYSGFAVFIAGKSSWTISFLCMAAAMALCALLVGVITEPKSRRAPAATDALPWFAGAWSAVAAGTGLFALARAIRWVNVDTRVFVGEVAFGQGLVLAMTIAAVAALLLGPLLFKGTRTSLLLRVGLAVAGVLFVHSKEIIWLLSDLSLSSTLWTWGAMTLHDGPFTVNSPFYRLALVIVSLASLWGYSYFLSRAFKAGNAGQTPAEALVSDQPRGKLYELFAVPFLQVWARLGKVLLPIIVLVLIYRTSDFTMGIMAGPLYIDLGYSEETIGLVQSFLGVIAVFVGLFLGGVVANQIGVMKSLVVGAVLTLLTNGFYAYFAAHATGDDPAFLALAIGADNIAGGFVTTVFIAYLSSLVDPLFAATQYALFSSLYALLNKLLAGFSGVMADAMGYVNFFLVTASYSIPALIMVLVVMSIQKKNPMPEPAASQRSQDPT